MWTRLLSLGFVAFLSIAAEGADPVQESKQVPLAPAPEPIEESEAAEVPEPVAYDIARRGAVTVEDAYRLFAMLAQDQGRLSDELPVESMTFCELQQVLIQICVVSGKWRYCSTDCLRRDVLAYLSMRYLGYRPGLLTSLFGMTRRYAHREMVYRELIAPGSPRTIVSGSELLSVTTRVSVLVQPHEDVSLTIDEIH